MALKSAPDRGARDWKFRRPEIRLLKRLLPGHNGDLKQPVEPGVLHWIIREMGQAEQLATFGELVDHEVTTGCFEEPIEMRPSRHRRDVLASVTTRYRADRSQLRTSAAIASISVVIR